MQNSLRLGDWNALCDSCGRKFKASMLKPRWDGLMVCKEDFEPRHPSDFLRVQRERISVPFARPAPLNEKFITNFGLVDNIAVDDSEAGRYIDLSYFASDYIVKNFNIVMKWQRTIGDQVTLLDSLTNPLITRYADSVAMSDSLITTKKYLKAIADSATLIDSGTILFSNYVGPAYFASDYVGTSTTF